jgi:signal transduction histidine kinase
VAMLDELSMYASGARRALDRRVVRLDDLLSQVAGLEARESVGHGVRVEAALDPASVLADAYYLRQVFENLLRNAREATEGRPEPRLQVSLVRSGATAEVRVHDNGSGIAGDDVQRVFQPFVSTKGKGMGLGLAICREIVEAHGGRIEVESAAGVGTTFTVVLPLHAESAVLAPA